MPMRTVKAVTHARVNRTRRKRLSRAHALKLTIQYATTATNVPKQNRFRRWIRAALQADARVTVRLVGLKEGRELNRTYRGRDYPTNVLTFVLHDKEPYEGDLALCAPVVSREARAQNKELAAHYAHLTIHGMLHLQGYRHERARDAVNMEKLETRILKRLGYGDPYESAHHG